MFLAIALLLSQVEHPPRVVRTPRAERIGGRSLGGSSVSFNFFEFAPTSGTGMGSVCACASPTGAQGETLTFTRASSATCTATATGGLATTGIANGDLVTCSTNQARVEYDSAGVKGLLVEGARTNSAVRSQEFDNASWTKEAAGSSAVPIVTANQGVAPDGTTTADRVQFDACALGNDSDLVQGTGAANASSSVYVKGYGGTSGSISVCQYSLGASACTACAYNGSTWTRCQHTSGGASGNYIVLGCLNAQAYYPGGTNTGAADVLLWGAQHETGSFVTSYIPTTSAAVTRATEATAWFDMGASAPAANLFSAAVTTEHSWAYNVGNGQAYPGIMNASPNAASDASGKGWLLYSPGTSGTSFRCWGGNDAVGITVSGTVATLASPRRAWCSANSALNGQYGSNTVTASAAQTGTFSPSRYLSIGTNAAGVGEPWWGIISKVCVSPSPTACR